MLNKRQSWLLTFITVLTISLLATPGFAQEEKKEKLTAEEKKKIEEQAKMLEEIEAKHELAAKHVNRGRYAKAIQIYEEIVSIDPFQTDIFYNLGQLTSAEEQSDKCVLYYTRYLFLYRGAPDKADIEKEIGKCARKMKDFGYLTITDANTEHVEISLDKLSLFHDSVEQFPIMPGTYKLKASVADYNPYNTEITIKKGEITTVTPHLTAIIYQGRLKLKISEPGATVKLEGKVYGTSPVEIIKLDVGKYFMEITKDGYDRWIRNVHIERDDELVVDIILEKVPK